MRRWHEEPRRSERDNEWGGRRDDRDMHRDSHGLHMSHRDDRDVHRGRDYEMRREYGGRIEDQRRSHDHGGRGYEGRTGARDSYREPYPESRRHDGYDRGERHDTRYDRHPAGYDQRSRDDQRWMQREWRGEEFDDYSYGQYRREAQRHGHPDSELQHRGEPRGVRARYDDARSDRDRRYSRSESAERRDERRPPLDAKDFEEYRGRDYGFSWRDGSNDATWREFDRWGNEYSNHARSEGFGWNRGSTRDPHFWSSPDRER